MSGEPITDPCVSLLSLPTLQFEQNCSRRLRSTARRVAVVEPNSPSLAHDCSLNISSRNSVNERKSCFEMTARAGSQAMQMPPQ